jgi:hypothetical protein
MNPREGIEIEAREALDAHLEENAPVRSWTLAGLGDGYPVQNGEGPSLPEGERVRVIEAAPLYALVDEQAEDEGLWSTRLDGTMSIAEAHLQAELRRLHALIESGRHQPD